MLDKPEMFIAVAKPGHFGRAAESLGITQPTLSNGTRTLEDHLGAKRTVALFVVHEEITVFEVEHAA